MYSALIGNQMLRAYDINIIYLIKPKSYYSEEIVLYILRLVHE